jgi:hypothetical protein
MFSLLGRLGRIVFWAALVVTGAALLLGWNARGDRSLSSAASRTRAYPRYLGIPTAEFSSPPYVPRILDTRTSVLEPCSLPRAEGLELLGCSPWRDRAGQYHIVARAGGGAANEPMSHPGPIELVRYAFPAGKIVDHAVIEPTARGCVCWAPDRSDRIVFCACDGRLYRYDFSAGDDRGRPPRDAQPVPLHWGGEPRRTGPPWLQDPCWPDAPELGGRMLVALVQQDFDYLHSPTPEGKLWWVQPDRAATNIIAARRAIDPDGDSPEFEERLPSVGRTAGGTLLLAYLVRRPGRGQWELWVAPIALEASRGTPTVVAPQRRRLAEACAAIVPAFSPDGRSIFAALQDERTGVRMHRFAVPGALDRSCDARDGMPKRGSAGRRFGHQRRG